MDQNKPGTVFFFLLTIEIETFLYFFCKLPVKLFLAGVEFKPYDGIYHMF